MSRTASAIRIAFAAATLALVHTAVFAADAAKGAPTKGVSGKPAPGDTPSKGGSAKPAPGEVAKADKDRRKPLQRCDQLKDQAQLECLNKARERIVQARERRRASAGK